MTNSFFTLEMALCTALAALSQLTAHAAMHDDAPKSLTTDRLVRYSVGVVISLGWYTVGYLWNPQVSPLSIWGVFIGSGIVVVAAYGFRTWDRWRGGKVSSIVAQIQAELHNHVPQLHERD